MKTIRLSILGNCAIGVANLEVTPESPLLFFLLLYLSLEDNRAIRRSELLEVLFPDTEDRNAAAHSLRQLLYRLRRMGVPLNLQGRQVSVHAGSVEGGLTEFLSTSLESRATFLERSIAVLPHYSPPNAVASEWIERLRDRWYSVIRRQLNDDLEAFRLRADWRSIESISRRLLEVDPLNESATLYLAEAIARTGSKTVALTILSRYEMDVGQSASHLTIPARVLRKRLVAIDDTGREGKPRELPLIGRASEIAALSLAWRTSRQGCLSVVSVTGDRSVGKTRLLQELSALVNVDASGTVIWIRPSAREHGRPLALFADIARQLIVLPGAAGCDPLALSLLRFLTEAPAPSGPIGNAFNHSLYDEAGIRNALCELITSVSEECPLLFLIDAWKALDRSSVAMLKAVRVRQPQTRALIVVAETARASGSTLVAEGIASGLHVAPLSASSSRDLLRLMIDSPTAHPPDDLDADWLLDVSAGNPGHLELLLSSIARGHPSRRIPADLVALVDQQVSSLSTEAQHFLQALAISGDAIIPSAVARITGLSDYALVTALTEIDGASLLREDDGAIACRSALIAERSLYGASPAVLRLMHERMARLLEEKNDAANRKSATLAWRICAHWRAAGQPQQARDFLRACWQQAIDVGQPVLACEAIRKELNTCTSPDERALLLDDLIGALQSAGELGLLHDAITERQELSTRVSDGPARLASLAFDQIEASTLTYLSPAKYKNSLVTQLSNHDLDSRRRIRAARLLMMAADEGLDNELASHAYNMGQQIRSADDLSALLQRHVALFFHSVFGEHYTALTIAAEIEDRVASRERSWLKYVSHRNCFLARQLVGSAAADYSQLERDYADCHDAGMIFNAIQSAAFLASMLIDDGDISTAHEWLQKSTSLLETHHVTDYPLDYLSGQVDLALLRGEETQARGFLGKMHGYAQRYEFGRLRNDLLLYQLRVEQMCSEAPISPAHLTELLRFHEAGKAFGRHDDHMDVLWVALRSLGRFEEASKLLLDYLSFHRRERRPCRYFLKTRTAADPAWSLMRDGAYPPS